MQFTLSLAQYLLFRHGNLWLEPKLYAVFMVHLGMSRLCCENLMLHFWYILGHSSNVALVPKEHFLYINACVLPISHGTKSLLITTAALGLKNTAFKPHQLSLVSWSDATKQHSCYENCNHLTKRPAHASVLGERSKLNEVKLATLPQKTKTKTHSCFCRLLRYNHMLH